mmetsp:Transcript_23298/g.53673  ORF Transcript_23298/g.53673 Transcript_23298/m.53673 type:complete len:268 (+) Transcript_23298:3029-3832(+)
MKAFFSVIELCEGKGYGQVRGTNTKVGQHLVMSVQVTKYGTVSLDYRADCRLQGRLCELEGQQHGVRTLQKNSAVDAEGEHVKLKGQQEAKEQHQPWRINGLNAPHHFHQAVEGCQSHTEKGHENELVVPVLSEDHQHGYVQRHICVINQELPEPYTKPFRALHGRIEPQQLCCGLHGPLALVIEVMPSRVKLSQARQHSGFLLFRDQLPDVSQHRSVVPGIAWRLNVDVRATALQKEGRKGLSLFRPPLDTLSEGLPHGAAAGAGL